MLRAKAHRLSASSAAPSPEPLLRVIRAALENLKAIDVREIDVRGRSGVTDFMVIASGTSTRHVKSIADEVQRRARQDGFAPIGVEGEREAEWVLVDLGDAVVHVMLPRMRELYLLERLWGDDRRAPSQDVARPASA
ncbi:MAG TPA: ribosome silencing factor [Chiayiivirga sp.]|nr:ribosome silencing factor [Chiayiivirga sp.]